MSGDNSDVGNGESARAPAWESFGEFYDVALPSVYGYLLRRCGSRPIAEDLTAETFAAAVDAARSHNPPRLSVPWIIGVARHKLVDHWRREARRERNLRALTEQPQDSNEDPWEGQIESVRARETLDMLRPHHRAVLTLRYVDDLPVAEVADVMQRSLHATEGLLSRARASFARAYAVREDGDD